MNDADLTVIGTLDDRDRAFVEMRRQLAEFEFLELRDWARRVGLSARKRRKLVDSASKAGGVSLTHLDALHAADWQSILKRAAPQEKAAQRLLAQHHARQRAALQTVMKHRARFEHQGGNPVFQTCMWTAANPGTIALLPFTFNQGSAGLTGAAPVFPPPTAGNNTIRFSATAQANAAGSPTQLTPVAGMELLTSHVFETTARAGGVLSLTARFAPLGSVFLGAPGDCVGFGGSASVKLTLLMEVRITPPGELGFNLPIGDSREIVDARIHAGCDAETRQVLVGPTGGESYGLANPDIATVGAGDGIRVTTRYVLRLSAALGAVATANFAAVPSGLNVPLVTVKIET